MSDELLRQVRTGCAEVARNSRSVRIVEERLAGYLEDLPLGHLRWPQMDPASHFLGREEGTVVFLLTLDAINFGSGFFPRLFGNPLQSGYLTIASRLREYFSRHGPMTAQELSRITPQACMSLFGLDPENPTAGDLMRLYAEAWQDFGVFIQERFQGNFVGLVEEAAGSAEKMVRLLTEREKFRDVSDYGGLRVPFYKRAQIVSADLHIAFCGQGPGRFTDIDRLTLLADNLVPHVLRIDGLLDYADDLAGKIRRGDLLSPGSPEEVEIRACAVHVSERLVSHLRERGAPINAMMLDNYLWHLGQSPKYRALPRHLTRTIHY